MKADQGLSLLTITFFLLMISTSTNGDLYNSSDPLVLLNVTNFYDTVLETQNAWIIEFYSSWCGHCINFAPTWRIFSHEVAEWERTIKAAVLDCSDDFNVPVCREYDVSSYPTIRLFGAFTSIGDLGRPVLSRGVEELQAEMIHFLIEEETANNHSNTWVDLLLYDEPVPSIYDFAPEDALQSVIIVEDGLSPLASQVILDLGSYRTVYVRRMNLESTHLDEIDFPSHPATLIVNRDGNVEIPQETLETREEITAFLIHHLDLKKKQIIGHVPNSIPKPSDGKKSPTKSKGRKPLKATDKVFMVDIENALSYMFRQEVSSQKVISDESLDALRNFTDSLVKFLPAREPVHRFLVNLNQYLIEVESLTGADFEQDIQALQSRYSILPPQQDWRRCKGSSDKYRGYPCSLWTMFHVLTVNASITNENNPFYDPIDVLRAIHGYVKYFFSCDYCSKHFQAMYAEDAENFVQGPNDEIEWLWRGHNKVNKRLKGDLSEDPEFPKQQFPTKIQCPRCRNADNSFDMNEVLVYLKKIYGKSSISNVGVKNLTNYDANESHLKAQLSVGTFISLSILSLLAMVVVNVLA